MRGGYYIVVDFAGAINFDGVVYKAAAPAGDSTAVLRIDKTCQARQLRGHPHFCVSNCHLHAPVAHRRTRLQALTGPDAGSSGSLPEGGRRRGVEGRLCAQLVWNIGGGQGLYRIGEGLQGGVSRTITAASVSPLTGDLWLLGTFGLDDMVWGGTTLLRQADAQENPHAHCFLVALSHADGRVLWDQVFHGDPRPRQGPRRSRGSRHPHHRDQAQRRTAPAKHGAAGHAVRRPPP